MENQNDEAALQNPIPEPELPATPVDALAVLEEKVAELNDKYLRLYSEYDNYRKRTAKEKLDLLSSAGEDVYKMVLPVLDDFERAIYHNQTASDLGAVKEGFNLIYNKFKNQVTQKGLVAIDPKAEVFNADFHEAITNIPAPDDSLKGKIIDVVEKGYSLNGKVIRFAKVVVGI